MELSKEALEMIALGERSGLDKLHFYPPVQTRKKLEEAAFEPGPREVFEVINIFLEEVDIPVRVYIPEGEGPFPIVAYYHGGGFTVMGIATHDTICRDLCLQAACVVLSVGYKLAPEHHFPEIPESAVAAAQWMIDNAYLFKADPSRLGTAGDGAGGYLAFWVAIALSQAGIEVKAIFSAYPMTDHYTAHHPSMDEFRKGYVMSAEMLQWFWDQYLSDPADIEPASILRHDIPAGLPPTFIINGNFDPLRDEGTLYAEKLKVAGVQVRHQIVDNVHGFLGLGEAGQKALNEAALFLQKELYA